MEPAHLCECTQGHGAAQGCSRVGMWEGAGVREKTANSSGDNCDEGEGSCCCWGEQSVPACPRRTLGADSKWLAAAVRTRHGGSTHTASPCL